LVEIPLEILQKIGNLTVADFTTRGAEGGTTGRVSLSRWFGQLELVAEEVPIRGRPRKGGPKREDFSLRLDGSDGKVTISRLPMQLCTRHASWFIPAPLGVIDEVEE